MWDTLVDTTYTFEDLTKEDANAPELFGTNKEGHSMKWTRLL